MKQALIFYIGNGILKCALSVHQAKTNPKILFIRKNAVDHPESLDKESLEGAVLRTLEKLCAESQKALQNPEIKNKRIDKIVIVLSAPWYTSETKTFKTQKPEPIVIREDTMSKFIEETEADLDKQGFNDLLPLERKIIHISLNGYVTSLPLGKKASSIELSVVQSFGDKSIMEKSQEIIEKYFKAGHFHFHALSLASFIALRDTFKQKKDFVMVNVTNLITEVSLIKGDLLYETVTLPIGSRKMLESLINGLNVTEEVAWSLLNLQGSKEAEEGITKRIETVMEEFKKEWDDYLQKALSHLSGGIFLPSSCYLICQMPVENFFSSFIEGEFKVEPIPASYFSPFVDFGRESSDSSVAIISLFASSLFIS